MRRIKLMLDQHPMSPREWDNLGIMACTHRKYDLGDEKLEPNRDGEFGPPSGAISPLPLDLLGGQVGWIYTTEERINAQGLTDRSLIPAILESEVAEYDAYLQGFVIGYVVEERKECEHCGRGEWETLDSCWGFFIIDGNFEECGLLDNLPPGAEQEAARQAWEDWNGEQGTAIVKTSDSM